MSGRFEKGRSGNPAGRPKARRPHVSAFDIIFDKTLTVTQNGMERELTVDEALQFQTYQAALKGSKMAVRAVLKMIEKRETALARKAPSAPVRTTRLREERDPRNADAAMLLLGITVPDPSWQDGQCKYGTRMKMATWATQAGISRPGRRQLEAKDRDEIKREALNPDALKWPRARGSHSVTEPSQAVGRGKPPLGTRFKKGHSGNPRGRPRNRRREIPYDSAKWSPSARMVRNDV